MIDDGLLFRVEESDDSDEDAFEDEDDDGPALVCSCTLGGPTVVIEAKTDNKKEELSVEEEEGFQDQDQEHHDKDRADVPFQEENGRGGESDGKVVRFEVTRETNIYHHHS